MATQDASLSEILAANMQLYPNPTNGTVTLENSTSQTVAAEIYDAGGRLILKTDIAPGISQKDLGSLDEGIYQIVFTSGEARTTQKLSVTH